MRNRRLLLCALGALSLNATLAAAGPAAWCKGQTFEVSDYELGRLKGGDPRDSLEVLAKSACSTSPDVEAHRAELDKARDAWGAKYGLRDADWADVIAWSGKTSFGFPNEVPIVKRDFASLTPIDQYVAIQNGSDALNGSRNVDQLYMTDMLDASLTQTGRLGFLDWCLDDRSPLPDDNVVRWAACQVDLDKFDAGKVFDEVRGDTAHDGVARMYIRVHAHDLAKKIKDNADKKAALIQKAGEYGKIYAVAAKAQADWSKSVGGNATLLELARDLEASMFFHSRKLAEGCEAKTHQALADAVSKLPAKSFTGMADDFYKANGVLSNDRTVFVAGVAYIECQPDSTASTFLINAMNGAPGSRGPRSAAIDAIMATTFQFDDTRTKLAYPSFTDRPYSNSHAMGRHPFVRAIATVKPGADGVHVTFESKKRMQVDCVKEHRGRLARIRDNGSLDYEIICDKTATVQHEDSGGVTAAVFASSSAKWLKPGALVSFHPKTATDVVDALAVWPSKTASAPAMVLGASVK